MAEGLFRPDAPSPGVAALATKSSEQISRTFRIFGRDAIQVVTTRYQGG